MPWRATPTIGWPKRFDRIPAVLPLSLLSRYRTRKRRQRNLNDASAMGFKGVMLNGTANGQFLDHPRFTPIFEAAQALDVPIYLHPAPPPKPVMDAYYSGLPGRLGFFFRPRVGLACGNRNALACG